MTQTKIHPARLNEDSFISTPARGSIPGIYSVRESTTNAINLEALAFNRGTSMVIPFPFIYIPKNRESTRIES